MSEEFKECIFRVTNLALWFALGGVVERENNGVSDLGSDNCPSAVLGSVQTGDYLK